MFVRPSVRHSVCPPQALSGLKSVLSGLIPALTDSRPERADFRPKRADSRPERADFRPERADFRPERADFRPERAWGGGQTDGRTDERKSPCVLQDFVPFGAAAQKGRFKVKEGRFQA